MSVPEVFAEPTELPETEEGALFHANERLRRTASWLLVIFGAIGATLLTGTQLSDWGELTGGRLAAATAGVALGLIGLMLAIIGTVQMLPLQLYTTSKLAALPPGDPLRTEIEEASIFLPGPGMPTGVDDLPQVADARYTEWEQADRTFWSVREVNHGTAAERAAKVRVAYAAKRLERVTSVGDRARSHAQFFALRRIYHDTALPMILFGAGIAAAGIALFAWAAHPAEDKPPAATSLVRVDMSGLDLRGVDFGSADLTGADLSRANLTDAKLTKATLDAVIWTGARCPDGARVVGTLRSCDGNLATD
ncbi:pentapeptide repeat-containing protein [Miltoncostaea oceani]|uniref:pentapeptide repeat-containing protein n=1 Tax=Miltoncostaea oceani TaxID=2843216 RepID=UPI001C3D0935|nr:pentapeptide repeat-containing protein [Miltoncostaea oceani]